MSEKAFAYDFCSLNNIFNLYIPDYGGIERLMGGDAKLSGGDTTPTTGNCGVQKL